MLINGTQLPHPVALAALDFFLNDLDFGNSAVALAINWPLRSRANLGD